MENSNEHKCQFVGQWCSHLDPSSLFIHNDVVDLNKIPRRMVEIMEPFPFWRISSFELSRLKESTVKKCVFKQVPQILFLN